MATQRFTLERRKVQIGAKAQGGAVAVGVAVSDTYAAAVMTPRKAEKIAAELTAAANRVRAAASAARRQKGGGFLQRFLPW